MRYLSVFLIIGWLLLAAQGCWTHVSLGTGEGGLTTHPGGGPPPWAPAHGYRAKYQYRYYPDAAVYLDVGRGLYFYVENGRWTAGATLPRNVSIDAGRYVILEMDVDKPYIHHKEVQKKYPPGQQKKSAKPDKDKKY